MIFAVVEICFSIYQGIINHKKISKPPIIHFFTPIIAGSTKNCPCYISPL